jgi:hypothetical protein
MTRFTPLWLQSGSYAGSQDRRLIGALWPAPASNGCAVTQGSAMTVNVAAGSVAVPTANNTGSTLCASDAPETVTLTAAPPSGSNRIDLIICRPRGTDLDGGANNDWIFDFVTGTAAATPTVPATPAGTVALAQIYVGGGVASIISANITDVRPSGLAVPPASPAAIYRGPFGAVALSGLTPIPLATPTFDSLAGFTTAGYVCRLAGTYAVSAVITIVGVPAANGPAYRIQRNTADYTTGNGFNGGSAAAQISYTLADLIQLAVGDTVRCAVGNTGGSIAASTGSLALHRIGG